MDLMREQVEKFGVEMRQSILVKSDLSSAPYKFTFDDGHEVEADTVIIAVGTKSLVAERDKFIDTAFDVINVGDCVCASSIVHAVHSGFDAGLTL